MALQQIPENGLVRVLHLGKFYPPDSGGMETHLHALATRQARQMRVSVVVASRSSCHEEAVSEGVSVTRVGQIATVASMPVCPGLVKAIRESPAELVHIHMPNPGAAYALLRSGHSGKVILTHHADTLGRKALRRLSDPFVNRVMRRASRIIVTSTRYLNSSSELKPYLEKCRVIPLGIDLNGTANWKATEAERIRHEFGDRLILSVGRLVSYKGFDILIRAMKHVEGKLLLIGSGPQHQALEQLVIAEGLKSKVAILGKVEDLRPYFAAASIFVLPSVTRAEAFGIVQLEAMAAGLPIINTDIDSGVPEVSVDQETGITVRPSDVGALAGAVDMLLKNGEQRGRFGRAAKSRAEAAFGADLMADRTMALYADVLGH